MTGLLRLLHILIFFVACAYSYGQHQDLLKFQPSGEQTEDTLTLPNGSAVKYRSYENIFYVSKVADTAYQTLNVYVPQSVYENNKKAPIFLKTNVGGYFASKASKPSPQDATGRALLEGYVVVIPGCRGWNSVVTSGGKTIYNGRSPAAIVDLKAAIRYLRHNDAVMFGDAEKIITDGTSAGGAMSSLMGATGNHPDYEPYLQALGAAKERDDVFACVVFCPIIDLENADMAYEWLYNATNTRSRTITPEQKIISDELADEYPLYLNRLKLKTPEGVLLNATNYRNYLKKFLIESAQRAKNEGAEIPDYTGVILSQTSGNDPGAYVVDIDLDTYLNYVVSKTSLKSPPAFDKLNVISKNATPENNEFGDEQGHPRNFTLYSLTKATKNGSAQLDPAVKKMVYLLNPMNFIGDGKSVVAKHWYIRNGALDRDAAFNASINLYTKLLNNGVDANFALAWNRGHSGDYHLDEVFEWIRSIVQ